MIIRRLTVRNFRNHAKTEVRFSDGINLLVGENGAGKTNLLDALHLLFMGRSFVTTSEQHLFMSGTEEFSVEAHCEGSIRSSFSLRCDSSKKEGKHIFVNNSPLEKRADLIGMVPVVVLSPDDRKLTKEGPLERRTFLDAMISQASRPYLLDLMEYRRILRHRNALLHHFSGQPGPDMDQLTPWDRLLATKGASLIQKRIEVTSALQSGLEIVYDRLGFAGETPQVRYRPEDLPGDGGDEAANLLETALYFKLCEQRPGDLEQKTTRSGPHRDDIGFSIRGKDLRKYGSQGQHRLFAIALKFAQLHWYAQVLDETPVLMLDDMFGELDHGKTTAIANYLSENTFQTFISVAKADLIEPYLKQGSSNSTFFVRGGAVFSS